MAFDPSPFAEEARSIFARHPEIAAVYLFGSAARGETRPDSDIDLGIVFRDRKATALEHHRTLADLATRLEALTGGREVDVVVLEPQGPIFCHQVLLEGRLLYEADSERRIDFESETMIRSFDERPAYERAARERDRVLREWLASP